jgi:TolB protein
MNKSFWNQLLVLPLALGLLAAQSLAQDSPIQINKEGEFLGLTQPTPITVTGFTGEVAHVLNFDLSVMGFIEVPEGPGHYTLSGSNNGNVQGQLGFGRTSIFSKSYSGASERAQAHRLADDVVQKITGVRGIAETKIAFKASSGPTGEIYVSDFDGHNAQAVTRDNADVAAPCWVPGQLALYYTSYKLGYPDIFYQNLATGQRDNFAHYGGLNSSAAVSPNGRMVAMVLSKTGDPDVFVCDSNGKNLRQLTHTREASSPCWSPDGMTVCFAARVNGRRSLYKVSVDGGPIERIPIGGVPNPSEPDWSPDGKWIAFTSQAGGFDICVVPAGGGSATPIFGGEDPSWSPNSRTLIFVRRAHGSRSLSVLDVPTKQVKDISRVSGIHTSNSQPSWAR